MSVFSRSTRALVSCAALILVLFAAPIQASAAPLAWESVSLVLHEDGSPLLIVAGTVPAGAELPSEAALSAPSGATLEWSGEVLGGPLEQDPSFDASVETSGAIDIYSFVVAQGPIAQLELSVPGAVVSTADGRQATIRWTAVNDTPLVRTQIRMPAGSEVTTGTPGGEVVPGPSGFWYYQADAQDVSAGEEVEFTVEYVPPAGGAAAPISGGGTPAGDSSELLLPLLLVAAVLGVAALFFVAKRTPASARDGSAEDVEDDDAADAPAPRQAKGAQGAARSERSTGSAAGAAGRRSVPRGAIIVGVAAVLVVVVFVAIGSGNSTQMVDGVIRTQIATVDECTSATYAVAVPSGTSLEDAAKDMFDALRTTEGIGSVAVYQEGPRIEVGFCQSYNAREAIGQVLSQTGHVPWPQ